MKLAYDSEANAAYIQIVGRFFSGESTDSTPSIITPGGKSEITLDFNATGKLLGIEALNAKDVLSRAVLADADPPAIT